MISIVTPSLNQAKFLEKNIQSVLNQGYDNFEHIIIDGGSTDGSIDILKKYGHLKWVSEKDSGQSNAINKGFKLSKGDIIGWLNSDDIYQPGIFQKVNEIFSKDHKLDFIFSNCLLINESEQIVGFLKGKDPQKYQVLSNTNFIPQPTIFFRKNIFHKTGYLNEEYHLSMDFDYWRRISKYHKMQFIDDIFACFREHHESKTAHNLKKFKYESKISFFRNGGSIFMPYYFEAFIKPKLISIFIYNPIIKKVFLRDKKFRKK